LIVLVVLDVLEVASQMNVGTPKFEEHVAANAPGAIAASLAVGAQIAIFEARIGLHAGAAVVSFASIAAIYLKETIPS
jgi:hypothetical protein